MDRNRCFLRQHDKIDTDASFVSMTKWLGVRRTFARVVDANMDLMAVLICRA
jgi:hypothetical protein